MYFLLQNNLVSGNRYHHMISRLKATLQQPLPCKPDFRKENPSAVRSLKPFMGNRKVPNGHHLIFAPNNYFSHIVVFQQSKKYPWC